MKLKQRLFAFQCSGSITLSLRIFRSAFLTENFPDEKSIPRTSSSAHRDPRPPGCPLVCSRESIETGQGRSAIFDPQIVVVRVTQRRPHQKRVIAPTRAVAGQKAILRREPAEISRKPDGGGAMNDDIGSAKQRLPLAALMHQLGLDDHAKKSARCPFHDDKHNSFSIWESDGVWFWKCHAGCGTGDEINFLEKHKAISRGHAIKLFLEMAGLHERPVMEVSLLTGKRALTP